jgi:hypothetical protein
MLSNICLGNDVSLFEHPDWHLTFDNHGNVNELFVQLFEKASNATELIRHDILEEPTWWTFINFLCFIMPSKCYWNNEQVDDYTRKWTGVAQNEI